MSSAEVQTATHQQAALGPSPLTSNSNRQYVSPITSPTAESYNGHQNSASSPSSRRPSTRKVSGNGHPYSHDPNSRSGIAHGASHHSPQPDREAAMAPVAPPRTSSSQHGGSSRRANQTDERAAYSPRQDGPRSASRPETNGATENAHRSKRAAESHFAQDLTGRPNENRDNRGAATAMAVRTQHSAPKPSREANENAGRPIATAEESYSRDARSGAQAHAAEAAAPPPVVSMSPATEERRGGRSRHDYSRQHKGTAKFGDFILGNTIGEGEFGKVKLGWKQDSSVQVR